MQQLRTSGALTREPLGKKKQSGKTVTERVGKETGRGKIRAIFSGLNPERKHVGG